MQHLNCVQKIRTRRNIQWKFELHFLLFQVKEEIVLFPKKKKMYFLPLLINLNSVISRTCISDSLEIIYHYLFLLEIKLFYITLYIDTIMDNTATSILIIKKDTNILLSLGRG